MQAIDREIAPLPRLAQIDVIKAPNWALERQVP
jgi:hypothetical protein